MPPPGYQPDLSRLPQNLPYRRIRTIVTSVPMQPDAASYAMLFDVAPEAMILVDAGGIVLRTNAEFTRLFGWTSSEAEGRSINDLIVPPEYLSEALAATASAGRGLRAKFETVRRHRDGTLIDVAVCCTPMLDDHGQGVVFGMYRDITLQRRAEDALRQSEEKFARAFRASPDALVISTRAEGRIIEANDRYVSLFGFGSRAAVIGRTVADLQVYVEPRDRERLLAELARRGYVSNVDIPLRTRTAGVRTFQLSAQPMEIDGIGCWLTVARDVTDVREAEAELRRSRARLRELAARLNAVREEERAGIAREIHDELGQQLTGLRLDLSWLGRMLPDVPPLVAGRLTAMIAQVDGTIDIVRRIASELRPGALDDLGLAAAVEWQADSFQERTGIHCDVVLIGEPASVDPDRAIAVFRILQEALTNVARHADARHVHIELEVTPAAIDLTIRDDGRGLDAWEAASSPGLGLVGMRERALQWEGEVRISGTPGAGTTVKLTVPQTRTGETAVVG